MKDRIRVLYIDDYELDRELVKDALEKEHGGFEVTEASNKIEFMDVLKNSEFDVVLSDFNIAGFEGLQVLDAVHRFNPDLPVIIVTGTGSEEIAVLALKQGAADYVIKRAKHILKLPQTIFSVMEKQALISQGRKDETALRSALQRLAFHVENSPLAVVEFDKEFRIIHWSKKAEGVFGWHADEVLGKRIDQFKWVHEDDAQRVANLTLAMSASRQTSNIYTNRNYRKDGSIIICEWYNSALVDGAGNLVSVQSLVLDITERKRLEDDLLRAQKLESVGILAGGIAHDFNNILTTIVGNVSMAKMQVPPEDDMYDLLSDVEVAALRAKTLTMQLLTFAKGGSPVKETASVKDILKENAAFVLRGSKSGCEFSMEEDLWPVDIDVGQISQVLNNILINANHAMPSGGTMRIAADNYLIEKGKDLPFKPGRYIRVAISDEGLGISREHILKIFDPYFTTKQTGSGLGLATAYSIIKKHDGHITVESQLGGGSTFYIYLPASDKTVPEKIMEGQIVGKGRILVMDDDAPLRKMVGKMLGGLGYDSEFAMDGAEAILRVKESKDAGKPYDAAILDLTIPGGMGGKEDIKKLLEIDPSLKAIVSSGYSNDPVLSNYQDYGFKGMIPKPFETKMLGKVLHGVIRGENE